MEYNTPFSNAEQQEIFKSTRKPKKVTIVEAPTSPAVKAKKYKSKKPKLLDINSLERRLENASKKDPRFFKPGDAELQKIQHEFYEMTDEQFHRVVGDMSWQLNPQNHINLYKDYIAE